MKNLPYRLVWVRDFLIGSRTFTDFCPTAKNALLKASVLEGQPGIHRVEVWNGETRLFLSVG